MMDWTNPQRVAAVVVALALSAAGSGCFAGFRVGKGVPLGDDGPPMGTYAEAFAGINVDMGGQFRAAMHSGYAGVSGTDDADAKVDSGATASGLDLSWGLWEWKWKEGKSALRARAGGHIAAAGTVDEGVRLMPDGGEEKDEVKTRLDGILAMGAGAEVGFANLREDHWNDGWGLFIGAGLAGGHVGTQEFGSTAFVAPYISGTIEWYPSGIGRFRPGYNPPPDPVRKRIIRDRYRCSAYHPNALEQCKEVRKRALDKLIAGGAQ